MPLRRSATPHRYPGIASRPAPRPLQHHRSDGNHRILMTTSTSARPQSDSTGAGRASGRSERPRAGNQRRTAADRTTQPAPARREGGVPADQPRRRRRSGRGRGGSLTNNTLTNNTPTNSALNGSESGPASGQAPRTTQAPRAAQPRRSTRPAGPASPTVVTPALPDTEPALTASTSSGFAELGVPTPLLPVLTALGAPSPFPIQAATLPATLAGRDVLGRGKTGSGKTIAFAIPLVARLTGGRRVAGPAARPGPAAHPRTRPAGRPHRRAAGQGGRAAHRCHLRRRRLRQSDRSPAQRRRHRDRLPGSARGPGQPAGLRPERRRGHRARRGRPHGRPRLPPGRPAAAAGHPAGRPAAAVLGHPGQRHLGAGQGVPAPTRSCMPSTTRPRRSRRWTHHVFAVASGTAPQVIRELAAGGGRRLLFTRTKHSAKKWAAVADQERASPRSTCTATCRRTPGSATWPRSPPARRRSWSPPTSRPAASTSTTSNSSCTSTRPPSTRPTCTVRDGPPGPGPAAQ